MAEYNLVSDSQYMRDDYLRSAPSGREGVVALATSTSMGTPRYILASTIDGGLRGNRYNQTPSNAGIPVLPRSQYDRPDHPCETASYSGRQDSMRRVNRDASIANGAIIRPAANVQLHPMMNDDGQYPTSFARPRKLSDFTQMNQVQLDNILDAYDLTLRRQDYSDTKTERIRSLVILFEFLGAHRLAEQLRRRN
ncbi:Hypothetical protein R9X50_00219900 [Acrodontium crateriforme]|uniref:Uncharacterized protein n=1 Tax=Acrodontium crateriforme TaxID=150365 RepID=A0AAQ3R8D5_9PEZI|nr:Hypothetical protein R9X50_00219900 [Acrodontium crateriforme]